MPFTKAALSFFKGLERNNNKQWFEAHRADYENEVREPMRALIDDMNARITRFAPEIRGDPKRSMFRINRDTRFSRDKSPRPCFHSSAGSTTRSGMEDDQTTAPLP